MKVSINIIFSGIIFLAGLSNIYASNTCLKQQKVEGHLFLREDKKIELILNKGTHKEIFIEVNKYDQLSHSCALEGCQAEVSVEIVKKKKLPRHYYAKEVRFLNFLRNKRSTWFQLCGFN